MTPPVLWCCLFLSIGIIVSGSVLPELSRHKREVYGEYSVVVESGCGGSTLHIFYIDWIGVEHATDPPAEYEVYTEFFPANENVYKNKDELYAYLTNIVDGTKSALSEDGDLWESDWAYVYFQFFVLSDLFAIKDDYSYQFMAWVRDFFMDSGNNPFYFFWDWVRILTADEEAAYWWLSLNYYRTDGYFVGHGSSLPSPADSYGILWQTRASAEIAFVPKAGWILEGKVPIYFSGQVHPVFADGSMGYGLDYINIKVLENLANAQPDNDEITVPCMLQEDNQIIRLLDRDLKLIGSGSYDECVTQVEAVLQDAASASCEYPSCGIEGKYQPEVDGTRFYALGPYSDAFSSLGVVGGDGRVDLTQFEQTTRDFSLRTVSDLVSENENLDRSSASKAYLMGVYAPRLFSLYGFQPDTQQIYAVRTASGDPVPEIEAEAVDQSNGLDLYWTVGSTLYSLPRRDICPSK